MAAIRFNDPIEPMDLANMRENGVRSLAVQCHQCRHEMIMNVDHLPGDLTVPSFGPRMVCTKGGAVMIGKNVHVGRRGSLSQPMSIVYAATKEWMPEITATRMMAAIRQ
jgi:hypothetical protein